MLEDTVTICTLCADPEEELLKMPNISQGILDDLLPNQEASRGLNLEESLLRSKKFLCPILAKSTGLHQNGKHYISPTRLPDGCRVTDGQLDLRPEEGGEQPEESASHGHVIKRAGKLIPLLFFIMYAQSSQVKT